MLDERFSGGLNENSGSECRVSTGIVPTGRPDPAIILLLVVPAAVGLLLVAFPLLMGEKGGGGVVDIGFYLDRGVEFQT